MSAVLAQNLSYSLCSYKSFSVFMMGTALGPTGDLLNFDFLGPFLEFTWLLLSSKVLLDDSPVNNLTKDGFRILLDWLRTYPMEECLLRDGGFFFSLSNDCLIVADMEDLGVKVDESGTFNVCLFLLLFALDGSIFS